MTEEENRREIQHMEMHIKYNIFNYFDDSGSDIDIDIVDFPKERFNYLGSVYRNGMEYFNALFEAERYIKLGKDVPDQL